MKITARVKPRSKEDKVLRVGQNEYTVRVKAPAREGRANQAVIKVLSDYFDVAKSRITIVKGHTSKNKIIVIQ